MTREYSIVLTPEPEGGFTITVPALPGYVGFADTEEQAVVLAGEGIRFHIESLVAEGQAVPEETEHPRVILLNVAA
jgi:antitoxin HicB